MGMGCVWDKLTRVSSAGEGWGGGGSRSGLLPRLNARSLISSRGLMEHTEENKEKKVFIRFMDELFGDTVFSGSEDGVVEFHCVWQR